METVEEMIQELHVAPNKTQREKAQKSIGWREETVVWDLPGFDPTLDTIDDAMHMFASIIRDFAHGTIDAVLLVPALKDFDFTACLRTFRMNLPSTLKQGRRFPRSFAHAGLSSWSAEECLVWLRLEWRHVFNCLAEHSLVHMGKVPSIVQAVGVLWEKLEVLVLALLDRRGVQCELDEVQEMAVAVIEHLKNCQAFGWKKNEESSTRKCVFSHAYVTLTVHNLCHIAKYIQSWGNVFESWCFVFERLAGVYTHMVSAWNHKGTLGEYMARRFTMRDAALVCHFNSTFPQERLPSQMLESCGETRRAQHLSQ